MSNDLNSHKPQDSKMNGEHKKSSSIGEKLKQPFQELKDKLRNTHLHDAKVHLHHKKSVYPPPYSAPQGVDLGIRS